MLMYSFTKNFVVKIWSRRSIDESVELRRSCRKSRQEKSENVVWKTILRYCGTTCVDNKRSQKERLTKRS